MKNAQQEGEQLEAGEKKTSEHVQQQQWKRTIGPLQIGNPGKSQGWTLCTRS